MEVGQCRLAAKVFWQIEKRSLPAIDMSGTMLAAIPWRVKRSSRLRFSRTAIPDRRWRTSS